jgi:hypothetical protein
MHPPLSMPVPRIAAAPPPGREELRAEPNWEELSTLPSETLLPQLPPGTVLRMQGRRRRVVLVYWQPTTGRIELATEAA